VITVNVEGVDTALTFPDGTKDSVIQNTVNKVIAEFSSSESSPSEFSPLGAALRSGGEKFLDNILQLPNTLGTFIGESAGAIKTGDFSQFGEGGGSNNLPLPTANDVFALAQGTGENVASLAGFFRGEDNQPFKGTLERHAEANQNQQQQSDEAARQQPFASAFGALFGDATTIATGRIPVKGGLSKIKPSSLIPGKAAELISKVRMTPGLPRLLDRALKTKGSLKLSKAAGFTVEAGFEGAALAVLNSDDPLTTAAYAAGAQTVGTTFIELGKGITSGGVKNAGLKIGLASVAVGSLIQILKEAAPGGRDNLLESITTGYEKTMYSLLLGGLSALGGFGRIPKGSKFAEDLPILADMLTSLPRNMVLGTVREVLVAEDEGNSMPTIILDKLSKNPSSFSKEARDLIEKSLTQEDVSFVDTVNNLFPKPALNTNPALPDF